MYAMTNAADGNEIVAYHRAADGMLTLVGDFATGGLGATLEPGDALGASGPPILSPDNRCLFAFNAGSNQISVFKTDQDELTLLETVPSGGELPVVITSYSIHYTKLYERRAMPGYPSPSM